MSTRSARLHGAEGSRGSRVKRLRVKRLRVKRLRVKRLRVKRLRVKRQQGGCKEGAGRV